MKAFQLSLPGPTEYDPEVLKELYQPNWPHYGDIWMEFYSGVLDRLKQVTETISVCGFATFLRTYPVIEKLAGLIQKLAPHAWVMNFTNPAGQIAETFSRLGCQKVVGVCNSALSVQDYLAKKLGAAADEIFMNWRGLNHLTFTDAVYYKGKNYFPEILDKLGDYSPQIPFPVDLIRAMGFLPNS